MNEQDKNNVVTMDQEVYNRLEFYQNQIVNRINVDKTWSVLHSPLWLTYILSLLASSSYSNKIHLICKYPVSAPTPALMTSDEHSYHYSDTILHHIKNK